MLTWSQRLSFLCVIYFQFVKLHENLIRVTLPYTWPDCLGTIFLLIVGMYPLFFPIFFVYIFFPERAVHSLFMLVFFFLVFLLHIKYVYPLIQLNKCSLYVTINTVSPPNRYINNLLLIPIIPLYYKKGDNAQMVV